MLNDELLGVEGGRSGRRLKQPHAQSLETPPVRESARHHPGNQEVSCRGDCESPRSPIQLAAAPGVSARALRPGDAQLSEHGR